MYVRKTVAHTLLAHSQHIFVQTTTELKNYNYKACVEMQIWWVTKVLVPLRRHGLRDWKCQTPVTTQHGMHCGKQWLPMECATICNHAIWRFFPCLLTSPAKCFLIGRTGINIFHKFRHATTPVATRNLLKPRVFCLVVPITTRKWRLNWACRAGSV